MGIQVFFMFPETRQKSLEEIDVLFDENIPAWKTRSGPSREDERAAAFQRGEQIGKRSSDATLHQDENLEKANEKMDRNVDTV
jgi:hypothetical protein